MAGIGRKRPNMEGINLMAAILLCYPEIGTVSYESRGERLHFVVGLTKLPTQEALAVTEELLRESLKTYHKLVGISRSCLLEIELEGEEGYAQLHIKRDFQSMSRGEISMLAELLRNSFGDSLIIESDGEEENLELLASREEAIEHMLTSLRANRITDYLVGVREGGKVVVYNK